MKKLIIILPLLLLTACIEKNPYIELGYNENEINTIETMSETTQDYILNHTYNPIYLELIKDKDFKETYFENYLDLINKDIKMDDALYIVNNGFYEENRNYDEITLAFLKSNYFIYENLEKYLEYYNSLSDYSTEGLNKINYVITSVNSKVNYPFYENTKETDMSKEYLIIVNKYNYLSENYIPDNLVTISPTYGYQLLVEKTTYDAFIKMHDDALNDGVNIFAASPYRSYYTQLDLYNFYVNRDGKNLADTYSARPGHSEHQTGLAIDITTRGGSLGAFEYTNEFKWLKENAYKYGFILRYPEGKEWITGYDYEPWHYRYVGVEAATQIYNENITFEEYYAYYIEKSSN